MEHPDFRLSEIQISNNLLFIVIIYKMYTACISAYFNAIQNVGTHMQSRYYFSYGIQASAARVAVL